MFLSIWMETMSMYRFLAAHIQTSNFHKNHLMKLSDCLLFLHNKVIVKDHKMPTIENFAPLQMPSVLTDKERLHIDNRNLSTIVPEIVQLHISYLSFLSFIMFNK